MLTAVALALGVAKLVQFIKEALPWPVEAWVKSFLTFVLAGLGALAFAEDPQEWLLIAGAASGLAGLVHAVWRALQLAGDKFKTDVIVRTAGRIRR